MLILIFDLDQTFGDLPNLCGGAQFLAREHALLHVPVVQILSSARRGDETCAVMLHVLSPYELSTHSTHIIAYTYSLNRTKNTDLHVSIINGEALHRR